MVIRSTGTQFVKYGVVGASGFTTHISLVYLLEVRRLECSVRHLKTGGSRIA